MLTVILMLRFLSFQIYRIKIIRPREIKRLPFNLEVSDLKEKKGKLLII